MTIRKNPQVAWPLGALTHGKAGRHFVQPAHGLPPADRVCNARVREVLDLSALHAGRFIRPGADHSHLKSKGTGC